ncbi:MAG: hypothetical protein ACYSOH_03975, partial [Planctomycetota bacterium]
LEEQGMDFDGYNAFAAIYVPQSTLSENPISTDADTDTGLGSDGDLGTQNGPDTENPTAKPADDVIDWSQVPPELVPLIEQLLGIKKP